MTGTQKLDTWKPQPPPNPELSKRLRQYVVEAVYAKWNTKQKPSTLISIFYTVQDKINEQRKIGLWPKEWRQPGKRTIDRRVNEAADSRFYEGKPKIVAVTAGVYQPNPEFFACEVGGKEEH